MSDALAPLVDEVTCTALVGAVRVGEYITDLRYPDAKPKAILESAQRVGKIERCVTMSSHIHVTMYAKVGTVRWCIHRQTRVTVVNHGN